ncbi:MAG: mannose-1-phosphate guanylyltransferase [Candidatus Cryptobacteroides sp.]
MHSIQHTNIVIMAGGIGSRLWPVSTPEMPKQFIDLLGVGKSLLQLTVDRFRPVAEVSRMWVVTSERYVDIVRRQIPEMPEDHILAEPVARNTAPCIAYACWKIMREDPEANIVVTPSDAIVLKPVLFADVISKALAFTADSSSIVTVGIHPDRPETGYGYICSSSREEGNVVKVNEFREKPDKATAESYLAAGNYFWNAGIFVWSVSTIVEEMRRHAPQIAGTMDRIAEAFGKSEEKAVLKEYFPQCDKISIDYAVMEKSDAIYVISADLGWSDLGSWTSAGSHIRESGDGNRIVGGDVRLIDSEGCIVHTESCNRVVVKGLKDYIIAFGDGNLLICPKEDEQNIKDYSADKPNC